MVQKAEVGMMKVQKNTLLLIACFVWAAAGFNILRIGLEAYAPYVDAIDVALTAAVFFVFARFVFGKLVKKHTQRIVGYEDERQFFLKFFDKKAFLIMAFMIAVGLGLRMSGLAPEHFVAVFYSGLGSALLLAGLLFGRNYLGATMRRGTGMSA